MSFVQLYNELRDLLISAPDVEVGEWQAQRGRFSDTAELEDVSFELTLCDTQDELARAIKPNLPWAEDHFKERVSGIRHNPPPSSAYWPYAQKDHAEHVDPEKKFSHTYPERLWTRPLGGIRFSYGNLTDVVTLLSERRSTRQAYIPIWFPEDTGAHHGERVPCTLGYHAMIRNDHLSLRYFMRSCDFVRHFTDDVYMAARLAQWLVERLNEQDASERRTLVGRLVMHISSLHIFLPSDRQMLAYRKAKGLI